MVTVRRLKVGGKSFCHNTGTQSSTEEGHRSPLLGREQDGHRTAAPQPSLDTHHCSEGQVPQELLHLFLLTK